MKLKNIHIQKTRHGKTVVYYRERHGTRVRMPDDITSPAFQEAYQRLLGRGATTVRGQRETDAAHSKRVLRVKLKAALTRDRRLGRISDLDLEWIGERIQAQNNRCALTGIHFMWTKHGENRIAPYQPSLDRLDNRRGYTKDNVRVILAALNMMRGDWDMGVFDRVVLAYAAHQFPHLAPGEGYDFRKSLKIFDNVDCERRYGDPGRTETTNTDQ